MSTGLDLDVSRVDLRIVVLLSVVSVEVQLEVIHGNG